MTSEQVRASDLGMAAFLHSQGQPLLGTDASNPRRIEFVFARDSKTDDLMREWRTGEAKCLAVPFYNSVRIMKAQLFSQGEYENGNEYDKPAKR